MSLSTNHPFLAMVAECGLSACGHHRFVCALRLPPAKPYSRPSQLAAALGEPRRINSRKVYIGCLATALTICFVRNVLLCWAIVRFREGANYNMYARVRSVEAKSLLSHKPWHECWCGSRNSRDFTRMRVHMIIFDAVQRFNCNCMCIYVFLRTLLTSVRSKNA